MSVYIKYTYLNKIDVLFLLNTFTNKQYGFCYSPTLDKYRHHRGCGRSTNSSFAKGRSSTNSQ